MIPPTIDPQTMAPLAFIRLLHQQGVDQTHLPEPMTFTSVLSFHDAVEHFLVLAGEHLGANLPDHIQFMKYWAELQPKKLSGGVDLSGKVGMDRLNRLRNGFKHVGQMPGLAAIEQARADVAAFFEDNTPKVFGLEYSGIDMTDLIHQPEARAKVRAAVDAHIAGDRPEAMALLVEAFDQLVHEHIYPQGFSGPAFTFGPRLSRPMSRGGIEAAVRSVERPYAGLSRAQERLVEQIDWMTRVTSEGQRALRMIALRIDFREYHRFQQLTPELFYTGAGRQVSRSQRYAPSSSEFDFCHQFVISVALRVAELGKHLVLPSWQEGWEA
ncbi:hypothetical protein [Micromonospora sp. WMMC250]|uniref:hypothetical protein n=1 Tax=Micromonospora sp. WMMC250 TaxID=3014781 RepID=UPI0022B69874|nr:hypothetical protein [Micromonospora sp. WMMC250]MCZ7373261.1 hypothetical protein [Micromonospora sp. WMMC250]MCZ7373300.1 hypothetical protein [Micromonospora sp. WMMC250]MCZ7379911.1 hypothetical protein [Micromonospora sp. WMMC250]